jgi:cytoskeleton protein RodZ
MVGTQLWPELQDVARQRPGTQLEVAVADEPTVELPPPTSAATATADTRPRGTAAPIATQTSRPSPTGSSETDSPSTGLELEVEATSDAWLMVQTDGKDAFMGFLRKGESRRWTARQTVRLKTGNAGGTQVTLNGQPLPALGGSGDVETREWRLKPNGEIEQSS